METLRTACDVGTRESKQLAGSVDSILHSIASLDPAAAASFSLEKDILHFGIGLQETLKRPARAPQLSSSDSRADSEAPLPALGEQRRPRDSLPQTLKALSFSKAGLQLSRHPPQVSQLEAGYRVSRLSSASGPDLKEGPRSPGDQQASSKDFSNIKQKISELKSRAAAEPFARPNID